MGLIHAVSHLLALRLALSLHTRHHGFETKRFPRHSGQSPPLWTYVKLEPKKIRRRNPRLLWNQNAPNLSKSEVDPSIGTEGHGHVFPGASVPWGMMQVTPWAHSPEIQVWDTQAGFNSGSRKQDFFGMAHSAFSGAGWGEMGEARLSPLGSGANDRLRLDIDSLTATPGYISFQVTSAHASDKIQIESTASKHGAIHRFKFPSSSFSVKLVLPAAPGSCGPYKTADYEVKAVSNDRIEGCVVDLNSISQAISLLCFVFEFDHPFQNVTKTNKRQADNDNPFESSSSTTDDATIQVEFRNTGTHTLTTRASFSRTDLQHARTSFSEVQGKQFEDLLAVAQSAWEEALGVVKVEIESVDKRVLFYTALYHTMLGPTLISDEDGSYRLQKWDVGQPAEGRYVYLSDVDKELPKHNSKVGQYATFSMWDTYRSLHPLMNLVQFEQSQAFAASLLAFADTWNVLPNFQLYASPVDCMVGDGGSIILGTMARHDVVDKSKAFTVLNLTRRQPIDERTVLEEGGLPAYDKQVSRSLEQAAADMCVARVASDLGFTDDANAFRDRAHQTAFQHWDETQRFFAPITEEEQKQFVKVDSNKEHAAYAEGSPLQYKWAAAFDFDTLMEKLGGKDKYVCDLDYFFEAAPAQEGGSDMTGTKHGMSIGNEPTMHVPYLYALGGHPSRTQEVVDRIIKTHFNTTKGGLPGNDDFGQMSSWLVFSMLGFYPADSCSGEVVLGRPMIKQAELAVKGGLFKIIVHEQSDANKFIQRATWQGQAINMSKPVLRHSDLASGGNLEIWMTDERPEKRIKCTPAS